MHSLPENLGTLHFIGIGGIGMSGIAEVLNVLGCKVQGSDLTENANVKRLRQQGVKITVGHASKNIMDENGSNSSAVVISSAVKPDNVELLAAKVAYIPVMRRAEMLAELMRLKRVIAISGTHGKTTTTSMVGQMLETANFDPTVINGGIVNAYGTNTRVGKSEWMVAEADESDGTFTHLPAEVAIVTNIDPEHLDHYGTFEQAKDAYRQFIHHLPFHGYAVLCTDHPEVQAMIPTIEARRVVTYGFNPQADVQAQNIRSDGKGSVFDVRFTGKKDFILRDVYLPMLGLHNVQNSLAALAIAHEMKVAPPLMKKALENFSGVKRRFTKIGEVNGIAIIDDYAHHPVEIETVLKTARMVVAKTNGHVIAVVQPHRFTRLRDLFEGFCTCFNEADSVIVADVYTAGEQPIEGVDKNTLAEGIRKHGHKDVTTLSSTEALPQMVADIAKPGDIVVCLGAGDITYWAYNLPEQLDHAFKSRQKQSA